MGGGTGPIGEGSRATFTIGLDVGGTKVAGALVSASLDLVSVRRRPAVADGKRDPGLAITLAVARELVAVARDRGLAFDGIGVGFPEYVAPEGRLTSHEVLAWTEQPADLLGTLAPVTVESDVRCAAIGEAAAGVARGLPSFCFVTVGTGVSYALLEDGRPRPGVRGEAIALGELEVSRRVEPSATVSVEHYASGEAIRARYRAQTGAPVSGAVDVFRRAAGGDLAATSIVTSAGAALGEALAVLVRLVDPGAVVVGGGVSAATGPWREALLAAYARRLASRPGSPPILWAVLGSDAGIIGAAIAHRRRIEAHAS
jgi:glucokinase